MDVIFYEAFDEEVVALRQHLPAAVRAEFTAQTIQEAGHDAPPASLISIRTQSVIPATWKLAGILSRTTGYDHLQNLRVPAGYLPLYCSRAVAEQAMMLWMALLRKLPAQMRQFGRFNRDGLTGVECAGKNLLVVGVGHIGSEVAAIGRGLGMEVRRVDIIPERANTTIEDGLPWADVIVCAMNLTVENTGYFNYDRLRRARRGVVFVNIARGEQSPTTDLARLLKEGRLGGLGLDVFEQESALATALRNPANYPDDRWKQQWDSLAGFSQVICTPHNAFNTAEALERKAQQTAQQVEQFLKAGEFVWPVPRLAKAK